MGKAIAFAQQKGGVGKTTVLAHLAHSWVHNGQSVGLIELDPFGILEHWVQFNREAHLSLATPRNWNANADIHRSLKRNDLTLVDCPSTTSGKLGGAIKECDLVIAPCQPTGLDVYATGKVLEICNREGVPCRVALNRVSKSHKHVAETRRALTDMGAVVLDTMLGNRVGYSAGLLDGNTSLGGENRKSARDEIEALRVEIDQVLATV